MNVMHSPSSKHNRSHCLALLVDSAYAGISEYKIPDSSTHSKPHVCVTSDQAHEFWRQSVIVWRERQLYEG